MIKTLFKNLFSFIKNASVVKKIILFLIVILYIFILVICFKKVNVEVITPGVIGNPNFSVEIESEEEDKYIGTIGIFTYKRVSLLQYWLSKNDSNMKVTKINEEYNISEKDELAQGMIMKDNSIINAIVSAYTLAKEKDSNIEIENIENLNYQGVRVIAVYSYSKSNLKLGDLITKVNGESFKNKEEFSQLCSKGINERDYLLFTIKKDDKEEEIVSEVVEKEIDGVTKKVMGIAIDDVYSAPIATPKYTLKENYSSIGPSGGAMLALNIYDKLISGDITKGKKIVGTGTIDINGNIGNIGGIEQKIVTAKNYNVDIFFVDEADYEDAKSMYDKINAKFDLVSVKTFADIIDYLDNLEV